MLRAEAIPVTRRTGSLLALGVIALLAFAVVTLPAAVLGGPLGRAGITATGFGGSVWSGKAQACAWRGVPVGDLAWTLRPLRLLVGRAQGHARLTRVDGFVEMDFDLGFGGRDVRLRGLNFVLPIEALQAFPFGLPRGWSGRAVGAFEELHLAGTWPATARGTLDLAGLVAPSPRGALGSFQLVFPHPQPQPSLSVPQDDHNLTAQVTDKDGPIEVRAQLTVNPARSFSLEGTLAARGAVPPALQQTLQLLGPADAAGRRQFSVGGTL